MILAGDVGGTKTLLGLFHRLDGKLTAEREASYPSRDFSSLGAMVRQFLTEGKQRVDRFCVGVAGPVVRGRSQVVNVRWPVDARRLARELGLAQAHVLNDLEAMAWGVPELDRRKLVNLTPGLRPGDGNAALIAAGTGLGMALLVREGDGFRPQPSEGGHQSFGPRDELEIELLRSMQSRLGRVSLERIVAGPGFSEIYRFLVESGRGRQTRRMSRRFAETVDANVAISAAALADEDATARKTLELFISMYGSAAGDLALVARATGGLYVGGGIAPKILDRLRQGPFVRAFRDKGRLTPLLEQIPIRVITEPRTALIGAAARAEASSSKPRPKTRRG